KKTALVRARFRSRVSIGSERVDARGKTREFARGGVPMHHASAHAAMQLGLRRLERGARRILVTGSDRGLHFLNGGADAGEARVIDGCALHGLTRALLRRFDIGHALLPSKNRSNA